MSKKLHVWFIYFLLSCCAAGLSYKYLEEVFPLVQLSITADRQQVVDSAVELAEQLQWNLAGYQSVTEFISHDELQAFVELEAGGKDAFVEMFQSGRYYPYVWHVRFFKEKEVVEMHVWFAPDGKRLGFVQKVSEQSVGKALSRGDAQLLVEMQAHDWCPNFAHYKLVEYDAETRTTGRIDHDFVYERTDVSIGKGLYRFKARVSGDVITHFEPIVKIPDNFIRRYQQMRSANNLLGMLGGFFFKIFYLLFFGLFGLVFFYRRNYLLLKSSSIAALVVAGGMLCKGLNEFVLWWVSYNTVQSSTTFIVMQLFGQVISFMTLFGFIVIALVTAEAAGRFVYKNHIQFFKIWTLQALGSQEVLQQVVFGYFAMPFMMLYAIGFGYLANNYFLWWSPAGSLSDPNIVASYFPWLGPIMISLQAGFFEEVVCRALPLAMVAVVTRHSRYKKEWFWGMFVLQALIFGACHASYPNQPFFARLVELIIPSFGFGWMYLSFGLLPGVITHFAYDAVLFALPIFVSNLFWSKILVVALIALPLIVVLAVMAYNKQVSSLPKSYFNQGFIADDYVPIAVQDRRIGRSIPRMCRTVVVVLGLCGLFAFIATYKFSPDVDQLMITKEHAVTIARHALEKKFSTSLDESWTPVAFAQDDANSTSSRFIWQVYGPEIYELAQGSYLAGVFWFVRFVRFSGAVEDRGEEYQVVISSSNCQKHAHRVPLADYQGHVIKMVHVIPEHFVGADISQEDAQQIANDFIGQEFCLQPQDMSLVSVTSEKLEERRNWTIVMQDEQVFSFPQGGQARICIKIAGDKVTEYFRFVFVPEEWSRADQARLINIGLVQSGLLFLLFMLMAFAFVVGVGRLNGSRLGLYMMAHKGLFIGIVTCVYSFNSFVVYMSMFNTAEPFYDQVGKTLLAMMSQISMQVLLCSVFLAVGAVSFVRAQRSYRVTSLLSAGAAGLFLVGVDTLLDFLEPLLQPSVGSYTHAGHFVSSLAFCMGYLKMFSFVLPIFIAMFVVIETVASRWSQHLWLQPLIAILCSIGLQATQAHSCVMWMLLHGIICGLAIYLVYYLLLRYDMTLLPLVFGMFMICTVVPAIVCPAYPGSLFDAVVTIIVVLIVSFFFYDRAHYE